jgi:hypothetical protein
VKIKTNTVSDVQRLAWQLDAFHADSNRDPTDARSAEIRA